MDRNGLIEEGAERSGEKHDGVVKLALEKHDGAVKLAFLVTPPDHDPLYRPAEGLAPREQKVRMK
jgi:hypothetical protein